MPKGVGPELEGAERSEGLGVVLVPFLDSEVEPEPELVGLELVPG